MARHLPYPGCISPVAKVYFPSKACSQRAPARRRSEEPKPQHPSVVVAEPNWIQCLIAAKQNRPLSGVALVPDNTGHCSGQHAILPFRRSWFRAPPFSTVRGFRVKLVSAVPRQTLCLGFVTRAIGIASVRLNSFLSMVRHRDAAEPLSGKPKSALSRHFSREHQAQASLWVAFPPGITNPPVGGRGQHQLSPLPGAPGLPKTAGCYTVQYTTEHTSIDEQVWAQASHMSRNIPSFSPTHTPFSIGAGGVRRSNQRHALDVIFHWSRDNLLSDGT
jgi:hypothetical protein